ncbi:hypothetical protein ONZ45_g6093 [Pleurotus djamor]|nr:hypothetical protein ONZ45_g6093 [Pleurotus djamor]
MTVLSIMCDGDSQSGHVKSNSRLTPEYPTMIPSSRNSPSNIDTPLTVDPRQLSSTPAPSNYPSLVSTPRTHAETPHHDYFTVTPSTDAFQAIFCAQAAEQGNGLPILPPHADYDTIIRDFMYGQANLNAQYHNPSERLSAASEFRLPQPHNQQHTSCDGGPWTIQFIPGGWTQAGRYPDPRIITVTSFQKGEPNVLSSPSSSASLRPP